MRTISVTATIAFVCLCSCARQPDPVAEQASLRSADSAYTAIVRMLDVPRLVAMYAPDAVMYPPGEATRTGLDAIREFATAFASAPGLTMTAELQTATVSQSGDLGYTVNLVDATFNDAEGNPVTERLRDVHFWRKDASDQWKVVLDVWNTMPPATQAAGR